MKRLGYAVFAGSLALLPQRLPQGDVTAYTAVRQSGAASVVSAATTGRSASAHLSRIRPSDTVARDLLTEAAARSYTVSALLEVVQQSDLIAYLQVSAPPSSLPTSQTRLLAGRAGGGRYVSVWIDKGLSPSQRIAMLGHELQHVAEIADAPEVASEADLLRFYQRIGYASWSESTFETRAAEVAQILVTQELLAGEGHRTDTSDGQGPAGASWAESRALFGEYCAACHGHNGRGSGPAARAMSRRPPDLTMLARRSGGTFPWSHVETCVRGVDRAPRGIVTDAMPVWHRVMTYPSDDIPAARARELAAYVESLQRR